MYSGTGVIYRAHPGPAGGGAAHRKIPALCGRAARRCGGSLRSPAHFSAGRRGSASAGYARSTAPPSARRGAMSPHGGQRRFRVCKQPGQPPNGGIRPPASGLVTLSPSPAVAGQGGGKPELRQVVEHDPGKAASFAGGQRGGRLLFVCAELHARQLQQRARAQRRGDPARLRPPARPARPGGRSGSRAGPPAARRVQSGRPARACRPPGARQTRAGYRGGPPSGRGRCARPAALPAPGGAARSIRCPAKNCVQTSSGSCSAPGANGVPPVFARLRAMLSRWSRWAGWAALRLIAAAVRPSGVGCLQADAPAGPGGDRNFKIDRHARQFAAVQLPRARRGRRGWRRRPARCARRTCFCRCAPVR